MQENVLLREDAEARLGWLVLGAKERGSALLDKRDSDFKGEWR
jgi:hypothetical protein